jgi:hypothetical protein
MHHSRASRLALMVIAHRRHPMDTTNPYAIALLAGGLLSAATFGACRLWHGRRLRELLARLDKADRARQAASQQAQQARKQIEQLQKELAAQHKARAEAVSARKRSEHLTQTLREPERTPIASGLILGSDAPSQPAHGFADTMPFMDADATAR